MKVRIDELVEMKNWFEELIGEMEERGIEELPLECNTYGLYGTLISIPGKGYLEMNDVYDMLCEEE